MKGECCWMKNWVISMGFCIMLNALIFIIFNKLAISLLTISLLTILCTGIDLILLGSQMKDGD